MNKAKEMVKVAYAALDDKKAEDIKIISIGEISIVADYFIIANGTNSSQIQALVENVEEKLSEQGYQVKRVEGDKNSTWILMDYGDIIVHIFDREDRLFYDLERIWRDGTDVSVEEL